MVSFTVVDVDKLHVGGLMLSGACSKEPVICLEQFTTQWKVSAKGGNCQRYSPLPISAGLPEIIIYVPFVEFPLCNDICCLFELTVFCG